MRSGRMQCWAPLQQSFNLALELFVGHKTGVLTADFAVTIAGISVRCARARLNIRTVLGHALPVDAIGSSMTGSIRIERHVFVNPGEDFSSELPEVTPEVEPSARQPAL